MKKSTEGESRLIPIRCDDHDENDPYADGDHRLLSDTAAWLLAASTYARQEWAIGNQTWTVDGLLMTIGRMRFNDIELAHVRRLLSIADEMAAYEQEDRETKRKKAEQVDRRREAKEAIE